VVFHTPRTSRRNLCAYRGSTAAAFT
jgi:hypothetical protein